MTIKTGLSVSAAVLTAALVFAGCGGSDSSSANQTPGAAPSDGLSTGPASSETPTGASDGDATSDSPDGAAPRGRPLPDGFPESEIPVVAGTIVDGSKGDAGGPFAYTVLIRVPGRSPAAVMRGIASQLKGTGFNAAPGPATAGTSIATYTNTKYDVGVNVVRAEGKTIVTYVVVRKVS